MLTLAKSMKRQQDSRAITECLIGNLAIAKRKFMTYLAFRPYRQN